MWRSFGDVVWTHGVAERIAVQVVAGQADPVQAALVAGGLGFRAGGRKQERAPCRPAGWGEGKCRLLGTDTWTAEGYTAGGAGQRRVLGVYAKAAPGASSSAGWFGPATLQVVDAFGELIFGVTGRGVGVGGVVHDDVPLVGVAAHGRCVRQRLGHPVDQGTARFCTVEARSGRWTGSGVSGGVDQPQYTLGRKVVSTRAFIGVVGSVVPYGRSAGAAFLPGHWGAADVPVRSVLAPVGLLRGDEWLVVGKEVSCLFGFADVVEALLAGTGAGALLASSGPGAHGVLLPVCGMREGRPF